jgi:heme A synthase
LENSDIRKFYRESGQRGGVGSGHSQHGAPFTDAGPPLTGWPEHAEDALRMLFKKDAGGETAMGRSQKWVASVALVGTVTSVVAAVMLWLVVTRPETVAAALGAWLGGSH